ncbi:heme exporter protein CcmD [Aliikangiella sp. G2MR2-5]|uniref:heme exporter protein CcmD n=1 Tax=Aliikangiella sp. G2MR2-5 TaxID=2788943 RepID=UPI0018AC3358|nr:heme exporter protein CcmD [Aliikangiella sp. G2MR2-5]
MTLNEFIDMGGYGFYVWSCYGAALVVFVGLYFNVKLQKNRIIRQLQRRYRQEKRKQQKKPS